MEEDIIMERIENVFRGINPEITDEDMKRFTPVQLAYIGDAVYELCVRTYIIDRSHSVNNLHNMATDFVKAKAQSDLVHELEDFFTEEEYRIIKRGRNSKSHSVPKNADLMDYKYSTGFESLIGYLYLTNNDKRIKEIFDRIIEIKSREEGNEA